MFNLTEQQKKIIAEKKNCVVVAKPGSGKTFVLSEKIKIIIPKLLNYKGVIAISYTNKASNELKQRCLKNGLEKKLSFFGTIDKFNMREIIIPFGKHLFGKPKSEISIIKISELPDENCLKKFQNNFELTNLEPEDISTLGNFFLNGKIILDLVGILSKYIFDKSQACKNFLKARYSHIIIDEYQDSGKAQHEMFIRLQKLGLIAIAVGDINQSIFAFSGKFPKFLQLLAKNKEFRLYPLDINHRSHPSIINYSTGLFNKNFEMIETKEINVYEKEVDGSEKDIANWLNFAIPLFSKKFDIKNFCNIAVLTRSGRTGKIINQNLKPKHKFFSPTALDADTNQWALIFKKLLDCLFNPEITIYQILEEYLDINFEKSKAKKIFKIIEELKKLIIDITKNKKEIFDNFVQIASLIYPLRANQDSKKKLMEVLSSSESINSFKPAKEDQIQIMTLHKSKGLEFDLVFHLDLYEFIMPSKRKNKSTTVWEHSDFEQDLNLHYVGITRAKKCCILCSSSKRTNSALRILISNPSEFLSMNNLHNLRIKLEE